MKFIQGDAAEAARYTAKRVTTLLTEGNSVLWLVSGGSNIPIQVAAMAAIPAELTKNLTILPVDERYGPYNHPASNSAQLRRAGFNPKHAEWIDILEDNPTAEQAATFLGDLIAREIAIGDYFFASLGIGADGHTAGVLPHSPALNCLDLVALYQGPDHLRITLSADALAAQCHEAVLTAYGDSKAEALMALKSGNDDRENMPVNILHDITHCIIFNDRLEGVA